MYKMIYELNYRKSKYRLDIPGLPSEFKDVLINIPYTSPKTLSRLLLALADQLIKTGNAIRHSQVKLNKQETYY
ncbi:MAG: hypothetical protein C0410_12195 [Anaerolinea sp.]|nr:hypothetical protein [Anaerolinea sp.]